MIYLFSFLLVLVLVVLLIVFLRFSLSRDNKVRDHEERIEKDWMDE
jgi:uncharacterized membrane protein